MKEKVIDLKNQQRPLPSSRNGTAKAHTHKGLWQRAKIYKRCEYFYWKTSAWSLGKSITERDKRQQEEKHCWWTPQPPATLRLPFRSATGFRSFNLTFYTDRGLFQLISYAITFCIDCLRPSPRCWAVHNKSLLSIRRGGSRREFRGWPNSR